MARNAFYSFHYEPDNWRAGQVRNMGVIEGNQAVTDNDWEAVKKGGDTAIQNWIDGQLKGKSVAIVLIGSKTAGRKWINYEIRKAWNDKKGVLGIYVHNLKDINGNRAIQGINPFTSFDLNGTPLYKIVKAYNSPSSISTDVYAYIQKNLGSWIEEAIMIRSRYG